MSENPFSNKSPEKTFLFSNANIARITEMRGRLDQAVNSLHENLRELEEQLRTSSHEKSRYALEEDITRHKRAIEITEEKLRDFDNALAHWEKELKKAATEILENFLPDKSQPN